MSLEVRMPDYLGLGIVLTVVAFLGGIAVGLTVLKANPEYRLAQIEGRAAERQQYENESRARLEALERSFGVIGEQYRELNGQLSALRDEVQQVKGLIDEVRNVQANRASAADTLNYVRAKQEADEAALEAQGLLKKGKPR